MNVTMPERRRCLIIHALLIPQRHTQNRSMHTHTNRYALKYTPDLTRVYNSSALSHSASPVSLIHPPHPTYTPSAGRILTSIHFPTNGLIAAQINNPAVAKMKMNTTASSFVESLSTKQTPCQPPHVA